MLFDSVVLVLWLIGIHTVHVICIQYIYLNNIEEKKTKIAIIIQYTVHAPEVHHLHLLQAPLVIYVLTHITDLPFRFTYLL